MNCNPTITADEFKEGKARFGFCNKSHVINAQKSADQDQRAWTWCIVLDGESLSSDSSDIISDKLNGINISTGDVIGLGCEIFGNAQAKAQLGYENWGAWSVSASTDESCPGSASHQESKDPRLSAEEIYNLKPEVWVSDSVSSSKQRT